MKLIILIALLFTLLFNPSLFSQGAYLERGQDALGMDAYYNSSRNYSTVGGSVGYSISGVVDLGASFGETFYENKLAEKDVNAILLSPSIDIHMIKQDEHIPISLTFSASYIYHSYISDALSLRNLQMTNHGFSMGTSLFSTINPSQSIKIRPSAGIVYSSSKSELNDLQGNLLSDSGEIEGIYYCFRIFCYWDISQSTIFVIGPAVFIHSDYTTFGIGAGFVMVIQDE